MVDYKNYRMTFDLHTHTRFSAGEREVAHAEGSLEENVMAARERGLAAIGISNHGPGHITYGFPLEGLAGLREEARELSGRYPDIQILLGVEANIINPSGALDVKREEFLSFDYVMAGYHYGIFGEAPIQAALLLAGNWLYENLGSTGAALFRSLRLGGPAAGAGIRGLDFCGGGFRGMGFRSLQTGKPDARGLGSKESGLYERVAGDREDGEELLRRINTQRMADAIRFNRPQVVTHPGDKGPYYIDEIAKACEETGTWLEINNFHRDLTAEAIRIAARRNVRFIIGSDAHKPESVGCFAIALARAYEAGLDFSRIVNIEPADKPEKWEGIKWGADGGRPQWEDRDPELMPEAEMDPKDRRPGQTGQRQEGRDPEADGRELRREDGNGAGEGRRNRFPIKERYRRKDMRAIYIGRKEK